MLPINGKNACALKGTTSAQFQGKIKNANYIIIDELWVIGQRMFGWINQRLRQISGVVDFICGRFTVIIVGGIAQLPPVLGTHFHSPST